MAGRDNGVGERVARRAISLTPLVPESVRVMVQEAGVDVYLQMLATDRMAEVFRRTGISVVEATRALQAFTDGQRLKRRTSKGGSHG